MGYLDNSTVTVDAILTNKGRQILAAGGMLNITKFALADDEVDYDLWNPAHTLGTNYYGAVIENMPILEALPDETQMLRYKLVTLPKDVIGIPVIDVGSESLTFTSMKPETITPTTINMQGANQTAGYTAILSDDTVATLAISPNGSVAGVTGRAVGATAGMDTSTIAVANYLDDEVTGITTAGKTITKIGTSFTITPKMQADTSTIVRCLLTIIGNETGGFKTITITVDPSNFNLINVATNAPISPVL
jgi:hypothetical protein